MTYAVLLALHIAVLGYWLGSEMVINSEYRFVVHRSDLPVAARSAMMDHVMKVDQHVRYALVLQLTLGAMLMAGLGMLPDAALWLAPLAGLGWLAMVETVHRTRNSPQGQRLALIDRLWRYGVAAALLVVAAAMPEWPGWLRIKLVLFAGIIGCGVLIRFQLMRHFQLWGEIAAEGSSPQREAGLQGIYRKATGILLVLWGLIAAIALLAVFKPG